MIDTYCIYRISYPIGQFTVSIIQSPHRKGINYPITPQKGTRYAFDAQSLSKKLN